MMSVGDIMSAVGVFSTLGGCHEYSGGVFSMLGGITGTLGDTKMPVGGYHEYTRGCSVQWRDTMSTPGGV